MAAWPVSAWLLRGLWRLPIHIERGHSELGGHYS